MAQAAVRVSRLFRLVRHHSLAGRDRDPAAVRDRAPRSAAPRACGRLGVPAPPVSRFSCRRGSGPHGFDPQARDRAPASLGVRQPGSPCLRSQRLDRSSREFPVGSRDHGVCRIRRPCRAVAARAGSASCACRPGCTRAHRARRALHERCHRRRHRRLARGGAGRARLRPAPAHAQDHRRWNDPAHAGSLDAADRLRWSSRSATRSPARAQAGAPRTAGSEN